MCLCVYVHNIPYEGLVCGHVRIMYLGIYIRTYTYTHIYEKAINGFDLGLNHINMPHVHVQM